MRRRLFSLSCALALLFATAGCTNTGADTNCTTLIGGGRYCIQPSSALPPLDVRQKVEIRFGVRRETIIVDLEIDANGIKFAGLTPFGHTLMKVHYDNRSSIVSQLPDPRLSPTLLLALLQIALWPADVIRNGLEAPLRLEEISGQRIIRKHDDVMLTITRIGERPPYRRITLIIPEAELELDIETLPDNTVEHTEMQ